MLIKLVASMLYTKWADCVFILSTFSSSFHISMHELATTQVQRNNPHGEGTAQHIKNIYQSVDKKYLPPSGSTI